MSIVCLHYFLFIQDQSSRPEDSHVSEEEISPSQDEPITDRQSSASQPPVALVSDGRNQDSEDFPLPQPQAQAEVREREIEVSIVQEENNAGNQLSVSRGHRHSVNPVRRGTPPPTERIWEENVLDIPSFEFRSAAEGPTFEVNENTTCEAVFNEIFTPEMLEYLVERTNSYGEALTNTNRPHTRHARNSVFRPTNTEEMRKFLGLILLNGHIHVPNQRKLFTYDDPLYFHPVFNYTMSCRRYEQLLRCLYAADLGADGGAKIEGFINTLTQNFRNKFNPGVDLSLDESLLLYRGRLMFRQYIKSKKARYGIKFYVLTTSDGYVLNIKMYTGAEDADSTVRKTDKLVLRLMRPYVLRGHNLYMDNFYNSVTLSEKLIDLQTHSNGTLRKSRKDNPKDVTGKKLNKGQHVWARKGRVYVSAWKDKREVCMITTLDHPELIEVTNRFGKKKTKPIEVHRYNQKMAGIDRADQMVSYYSSPRKTIRWYKKVLFHLLDTAVWNSFYIFKNYVKKNTKYEFIKYREELIRKLIGLNEEKGVDLVQKSHKHNSRRFVVQPDPVPQTQPEEASASPSTSNHGHWPTRMMPSSASKKKFAFLSCKQCSKSKIRRDTSYYCKGCDKSPALCPSCFEDWHKDL